MKWYAPAIAILFWLIGFASGLVAVDNAKQPIKNSIAPRFATSKR